MGIGLSAVIAGPLDRAYFFRATEYIRYDWMNDKALRGYPKSIQGAWYSGWSDIDSAVTWPNGKAYLFRGHEYVRYDFGKGKVDAGYPKKIAGNWPGVFGDGLDAVLTWPNGKAYFFKGDEYIRYDVAKDKADAGYPKKIAGNWPGVWTSDLDAAVLWPNGKAYFFKGDQYIRYDVKKDKADAGYPKKIAGNWPGIWETYQFTYQAAGVPDTDQKWDQLPADGSNYCVPTASYNWLEFLEGKGVNATIAPAFPGFARSVWNLAQLGAKMDTDPNNGTSFDNAVDGLAEWMGDRGTPSIIIGQRFSNDSSLTRSTIESYVRMGTLTNLCYGYWTKSGGSFSRNGGHCMTLVSVDESGSKYRLGFHNPNNSSSTSTQDPTNVQTFDPTAISGDFDGDDVTLLKLSQNGSKYQVLDTVIGILPWTAVTVVAGSVSWAAAYNAADLTHDGGDSAGDGGPGSGSAKLPFAGAPTDLAIHPTEPWRVVVPDPDSGNVWELDLLRQRWRVLAELPAPVTRLTFGGVRAPRLFAAYGSDLSVVHTRTGEVLKRAAAPTAVAALSWDRANGQLLVIDELGSKLTRLDVDLRARGTQAIAVPAGQGRLSLSVRTADGTVYLARAGDPTVMSSRSRSKTNSVIASRKLTARGSLGSLQVDPGGLVASVGGKVVLFDKDGQPRSENPFADLKVGPLLKVTRSWHNLSDTDWRA